MVANQSDTAQKSLQAHFSCTSSLWLTPMPTTHHSCQPNAPCSRAHYTSWQPSTSFSHPTGCKPPNSKHWKLILLLNLQYSWRTDRRSLISGFFPQQTVAKRFSLQVSNSLSCNIKSWYTHHIWVFLYFFKKFFYTSTYILLLYFYIFGGFLNFDLSKQHSRNQYYLQDKLCKFYTVWTLQMFRLNSLLLCRWHCLSEMELRN